MRLVQLLAVFLLLNFVAFGRDRDAILLNDEAEILGFLALLAVELTTVELLAIDHARVGLPFAHFSIPSVLAIFLLLDRGAVHLGADTLRNFASIVISDNRAQHFITSAIPVGHFLRDLHAQRLAHLVLLVPFAVQSTVAGFLFLSIRQVAIVGHALAAAADVRVEIRSSLEADGRLARFWVAGRLGSAPPPALGLPEARQLRRRAVHPLAIFITSAVFDGQVVAAAAVDAFAICRPDTLASPRLGHAFAFAVVFVA